MYRILFSLFLLSALKGSAQDTARINAKMDKATVYFGYGAELTHSAKIKVTPETRFVLIDQLSSSVDLNSLQVSCPEDVSILSQRFMLYTPPVPIVVKSPEWLRWEDSLAKLRQDWNRIDNQEKIEEETMRNTGKLIESTLGSDGPKTVTSAEVLKLVEYYNNKIGQSRNRIFSLKEAKLANLQRQGKVQEKLSEIQGKSPVPVKSTGRIVLQVISRRSGEIPVSLSYYTANAGWSPNYDVRVNSKTNKVKLVYKASLTQTTGIDWKGTKLTLSTGTPNFGVSAPVLSPWYLQLYVPELYRALQGRAAGVNLMRNQVQSFADDKALNEVVITGYGNQVRQDYADTIQPYTLQDFTTLQSGQLNTNFEIDLPYDIASDGELHSVSIKDEEIASVLKNYAVPRVDPEAYLLAEVADWQNLDLLPGDANIIMDDTYIGKSVIDPNTTADTLNLPLGRDKRLVVKRSSVKELSSLKSSGGYNRQTFSYEIVVKNNKLTDVNALIKDQVPLSQIKEVEVKLEDDGGAAYNAEVGVLTWKLDLKPGESRKLRFSYTVKYPRDKRIVNLK